MWASLDNRLDLIPDYAGIALAASCFTRPLSSIRLFADVGGHAAPPGTIDRRSWPHSPRSAGHMSQPPSPRIRVSDTPENVSCLCALHSIRDSA